jgi:hypothetical protein
MRSAIALGLVLLLTSAVHAQEGEYDLTGRYSTRRATAALLRVTRDASGLTFERTGRYTAARYASRPPFVWRSERVVRRNAVTYDVTYRLGGGLAGAVSPTPENLLRARYVVRGSSIRESVVNTTRRGDQSFWVTLTTTGTRRSAAFDVTVTTGHPGARLVKQGDTWVLSSDPTGSLAALGRRATGALMFDGRSVALEADVRGYFVLTDLPTLVPDRYHAKQLEVKREGDVVRVTFLVARDPAGAPTLAQARALARAGLIDHIQRVRMHEGDWKDYFPSTWPELQAQGIEGHIDHYLDPTNADTEVMREPEKYVFVGRGPFDLYTEVEVSKVDGSILRAYVEID